MPAIKLWSPGINIGISIALCLLILINILYVGSGVRSFGISSIDSTAIWLFKAKAAFVEQGIPWTVLKKTEFSYQHPQYPVALPVVLSLGFWLGAGQGEGVLWVYPVVYVLTLLICYRVLSKLHLPPNWALAATYAYSMFSPLLAAAGRRHAGEADIILVLISWMLLWLLQISHSKPELRFKITWMITALIVIASQVKMEGVFLAAVVLFLPNTWLTKSTQFVTAVIPFAAWSLVTRLTHLPNDFGFIIPGPMLFAERCVVILIGIIREMIKVHQWYIFWPVLLLSVFVGPIKTPWIKSIALPSLSIVSGLFVLVYLTTSLDTGSHLVSSIDRVLLQLTPWIFVIFCEKIKNYNMFRSRAKRHV